MSDSLIPYLVSWLDIELWTLLGTKFHSKKIGHRTVQISSESKDTND